GSSRSGEIHRNSPVRVLDRPFPHVSPRRYAGIAIPEASPARDTGADLGSRIVRESASEQLQLKSPFSAQPVLYSGMESPAATTGPGPFGQTLRRQASTASLPIKRWRALLWGRPKTWETTEPDVPGMAQ